MDPKGGFRGLDPVRQARLRMGLQQYRLGRAVLPASAQSNGSSGLAEVYSNMPADQQQAILQ